MVRRGYKAWLAAALLLPAASGKVVSGKVKLTGEFTEREMAKFAFPIGAGTVKVTLGIDGSYGDDRELSIYAYLDDEWPTVQKLPTCDEKVKLARWAAKVAWKDGAFVAERIINGNIRTHVWYFLLSDCSLEKYLHKVPDISYTVELKMPSGSHLPMDESGMRPLVRLNLFLASALLAGLVFATRKRAKKECGVEVHAALAFLGVAVATDVLSSLFELWHIGLYEADGVGSYFFDALSAQTEAVSDSIVGWLLLCIGAGWTLQLDNEKGKSAGDSSSPLAVLSAKLQRPLSSSSARFGASIVLLLHCGLAQWSRIYDDDFQTFHDFEHLPGLVVVALRLLLLFAFVALANQSRARAGSALGRFLALWTAFGAAWFLAVPVLSLVAALSPAYARHRIVAGGGEVLQTAALAGLVGLFTGTSKLFLKHSTVGGGASNLSLDVGSPAVKIGNLKVRCD